jgi:hypothetical protein
MSIPTGLFSEIIMAVKAKRMGNREIVLIF